MKEELKKLEAMLASLIDANLPKWTRVEKGGILVDENKWYILWQRDVDAFSINNGTFPADGFVLTFDSLKKLPTAEEV